MVKKLKLFLLLYCLINLVSAKASAGHNHLADDDSELQTTTSSAKACFQPSISNLGNYWSGEEYAANALLQERWASRFFFERYEFKGAERILDIGCGDGKVTAQLAAKSPEGLVIGIDFSQQMITKAEEIRTRLNLNNLRFTQQDAQVVSFYEENYPGAFDLVTSFTALHWMRSQREVLQGAYIALKKSGKFYFRLCSEGGDPVYDIANELANDKNYSNDFINFEDSMTRFNIKSYMDLLKNTGFTVSYIEEVEEQDKLEGREALAKQIKSWLPQYRYLKKQTSSDKADGFVNFLIDKYIQKYPQHENGCIVLIDHYLQGIAEKH